MKNYLVLTDIVSLPGVPRHVLFLIALVQRLPLVFKALLLCVRIGQSQFRVDMLQVPLKGLALKSLPQLQPCRHVSVGYVPGVRTDTKEVILWCKFISASIEF